MKLSDPQYLFALLGLFFILFSLYKALMWNRSFRARRKVKNQFMLFAVRDEFVYLVASEKISEESWLFQTFYESLNRIISHQHRFNFTNLVRAMRDETIRAESQDFKEKLINEIKQSTPEAQDTIKDFYEAMVNIVLNNSQFIRMTIQFGSWAAKLGRFIGKYMPHRLFKPQRYAYQTYNSSKGTLSILSA